MNRFAKVKRHIMPVWLAVLSLFGFLLLTLAYGDHSDAIFLQYMHSWKILLLNMIPVFLMAFFLLAVTGSFFAAYFLSTGIMMLFSLVNYYKLCFRDDPVIFEDLLYIREASTMAGQYTLFVNWRIMTVLLCWLAGGVLIFLFRHKRIKKPAPRIYMLLSVLLLGAVIFPMLYGNDELYRSLGTDTYWTPTEYAVSRGGIYPFLYSINSAFENAPEDYKEGHIKNILSEYEESDIPQEKKVNLIALMREAYVDFSSFEINGLDCSGYKVYHELKEESYTGSLVTNIFAGGTVNTERCFLTGDYKLKDYRKNTNSYVWYFRQQGYAVEGSHPFFQYMYNRRNINQYLGFDKYRYYENDFEHLSQAYYPEDSVLLPEIYKDFLKNKEDGKPYFSFSVNVQSHGPYAVDALRSGNKEYLTGDYSDECKFAVNNYMNIIMEQDLELKRFMEMLRNDPEPVVFILFSDHLPWMGNGNSFYSELGMEFRTETEEGFYDYYSTEYLIWANDAAKKALNNDFTGEGPTISPCYLMNEVFKQCGWKGPAFMQAMDDMMQIFPVVSTNGRYVVDGHFVDAIPEERLETMRDLEGLGYYWRNNFLYK